MNFLKKGLSQFANAVGESARGAGSSSASGALDGLGQRTAGGGAGGGGASSSSSAAAAADGSSSSSALTDPSMLPEIRFDERNGNEAHTLFLWTVYAGAPADSPMQEEALESFTEGFVHAFDDWMPAEDAFTAAGRRGAGGGGGVVMGCATGHPATVLRAFTAALRRGSLSSTHPHH